MKRNINIVSNSYRTSIKDFESCSIDNVNSMVDCSVDNIVFFCMDGMEKNTAKQTLHLLCEKLRPEGRIAIKFIDIKNICLDYIKNKIGNDDFIKLIKNIENPLSLDEIITYIDISRFKIVNITRNNTDIIINIIKTTI
jgi:hypothetical protein